MLHFKGAQEAAVAEPGVTIALGTPIFTPYLEMPVFEDYGLDTVDVSSAEEYHFQLKDDDFEQLADHKVTAMFLVNPGHSSAVAINPEVMSCLVDFAINRRPDLMNSMALSFCSFSR